MTRTEKPKFTNKKSTALFLIVFLFVFLFVNFGKIALAQDINGGLQYELSDYAPSNLPDASDSCKISLTHPVDTTLSCLLLPASGALVSLAVTLFSWAIDPAKMKAVIDSESVFLAWKTVRDFLNIAFILFLLFSAFCTIFQVSKYSYKNILLNLVLMALLVNFSFPIARFIIDVSNVLMYTMLNGLFPGGAGNLLAGNFADLSQIANVIKPANAGLVQIVMAVIFLFILGVTFLVMALLFVIRIIALAILIIFSPIAFTGSIIPGLQDKASSWWTHLFNYSFFGPIMIFMIYIAFSLANATSVELGKDIATIASKNSNDPGWLASLCKFIIPIIILWIGMGIAKSMSGEAGAAVIGYANGKLKEMGNWFKGRPMWAFKKTGIPGGAKQRWDKFKKDGPFGSDAVAAREAKVAERFGVEGALNEHNRKKTAEILKDWKDNGAPKKDDLKKLINGGGIKGRAAAMRLAQDGNLSDDDYAKAMALLKTDIPATDMFENEVKKNQRDLILINTLKTKGEDELYKKLSNLSNSDLKSINFKNLSDKGGEATLEKYFRDMEDDDKVQVGRNINKDNRTYLRDKMFIRKK